MEGHLMSRNERRRRKKLVEAFASCPWSTISLSTGSTRSGVPALNVQPDIRSACRDHTVLVAKVQFARPKPATSNTQPDRSDNPEGRARNRRVEVDIPRAWRWQPTGRSALRYAGLKT
jgi:hypothetical protein